jgi:hypothetical protein
LQELKVQDSAKKLELELSPGPFSTTAAAAAFCTRPWIQLIELQDSLDLFLLIPIFADATILSSQLLKGSN